MANSIVANILAVFTMVAEWFGDVMPTILEMFYNAETGLTVLGTVIIISLSVSVALLLINIVKSFVTFR